MMQPIGDAMNELAGEVEAGKYASADLAMAAFGQKMQGVMQKMMGGMKPPGGGG
jgi:hypothetical protein